MKAITYTFALIFMGVSMAAAAGSPSVKPSVSKDAQYYNTGVNLMLDKNFSEAEKQFRKAIDTTSASPRLTTTWPTPCENRVPITMRKPSSTIIGRLN